MIKYVIVACLCLMLVLAEGDNQETTTNKRVERDVDMENMPQAPGFPGQFADMANTFKEGMRSAMSAMSDVMSKAQDAMDGGGVRRRRDLQQQ